MGGMSVCSLLIEEDTGLTRETEVVEYPRVTDKENYVFCVSHTFDYGVTRVTGKRR